MVQSNIVRHSFENTKTKRKKRYRERIWYKYYIISIALISINIWYLDESIIIGTFGLPLHAYIKLPLLLRGGMGGGEGWRLL